MAMRIFGTQGAWQGHERLDEAAHQAVRRAEAAAYARGLRQATPDLLLFALLHDEHAVPSRALNALGVDLAPVRDALRFVSEDGDEAGLRRPLDDAAREAVILGVNEARRGGFEQAGAGHLLLGLLEARTGTGVRLLIRAGVQLDPLRALVHEMEEMASDGGAALFMRRFSAFLDRAGGSSVCPYCAAAIHTSFHYCYNCGMRLAPGY